MKTLIILFLVLTRVSVWAEAVSLYRVQVPGLKIYSASANLSEIYYHDMDGKEDVISGQFTRQNRQQIAAFEKIQFTPLGVDLSTDVLEQLQKNLIDHPVAGTNPQKNYDDKGGKIGFCYGRALLVQKELERLGVDKRRIFKVFLLGELSQQGVLWDYHVATLYVNHRGEKFMIDSLNEKVLPLSEWYNSLHRYFLNPDQPKVLLYFAEADKFQARAGQFNVYDVFNPLYGGYFFDLALWL